MIHEGHPGIVRMKMFARNYVWWPKLDVFVIIFGASGPGDRSIRNIAQWDIDLSSVGIVKESESCDQSAVSEGRPWSCCKSAVKLIPGLRRYSLHTYLAALRWTPSILLISPT